MVMQSASWERRPLSASLLIKATPSHHQYVPVSGWESPEVGLIGRRNPLLRGIPLVEPALSPG